MTDPIRYPLSEIPAPGAVVAIRPGLFWLRMPLPIALDHINLYLLEDESGWYVVDTGMNLPEIQQLWHGIFEQVFDRKPLLGVIVTHMHPDHVGLAGWLCETWKAPLYMSFGEYFSGRVYSNMRDGLSWTTERFFRRAGQGQDYIDFLAGRMGRYNKLVYPMPEAYVRLSEDDELTIGGRRWRVITGAGHSPEHVSLYCEADAILLAGDQLIARISSNVSVMATEPEGNPLQSWFDALRKIAELPDNTLVCAAHNKPFLGLRYRVEELLEHHEQHMVALAVSCREPKSAVELLPVLFKRSIDNSQMGMALGEILAHLHLMMRRGQMQRDLVDGLYRYSTITPDHWPAALPASHIDDEPLMV